MQSLTESHGLFSEDPPWYKAFPIWSLPPLNLGKVPLLLLPSTSLKFLCFSVWFWGCLKFSFKFPLLMQTSWLGTTCYSCFSNFFVTHLASATFLAVQTSPSEEIQQEWKISFLIRLQRRKWSRESCRVLEGWLYNEVYKYSHSFFGNFITKVPVSCRNTLLICEFLPKCSFLDCEKKKKICEI